MIRRIKYNGSGSIRTKGIVSGRKVVVASVIGFAATLAMAAPAFAAFDTYGTHGPTPVAGTPTNPNPCFGLGRASYAQGGPNGVLSPYSNGSYISLRAGSNPSVNDVFADNCGSPAGH